MQLFGLGVPCVLRLPVPPALRYEYTNKYPSVNSVLKYEEDQGRTMSRLVLLHTKV